MFFLPPLSSYSYLPLPWSLSTSSLSSRFWPQLSSFCFVPLPWPFVGLLSFPSRVLTSPSFPLLSVCWSDQLVYSSHQGFGLLCTLPVTRYCLYMYVLFPLLILWSPLFPHGLWPPSSILSLLPSSSSLPFSPHCFWPPLTHLRSPHVSLDLCWPPISLLRGFDLLYLTTAIPLSLLNSLGFLSLSSGVLTSSTLPPLSPCQSWLLLASYLSPQGFWPPLPHHHSSPVSLDLCLPLISLLRGSGLRSPPVSLDLCLPPISLLRGFGLLYLHHRSLPVSLDFCCPPISLLGGFGLLYPTTALPLSLLTSVGLLSLSSGILASSTSPPLSPCLSWLLLASYLFPQGFWPPLPYQCCCLSVSLDP